MVAAKLCGTKAVTHTHNITIEIRTRIEYLAEML